MARSNSLFRSRWAFISDAAACMTAAPRPVLSAQGLASLAVCQVTRLPGNRRRYCIQKFWLYPLRSYLNCPSPTADSRPPVKRVKAARDVFQCGASGWSIRTVYSMRRGGRPRLRPSPAAIDARPAGPDRPPTPCSLALAPAPLTAPLLRSHAAAALALLARGSCRARVALAALPLRSLPGRAEVPAGAPEPALGGATLLRAGRWARRDPLRPAASGKADR